MKHRRRYTAIGVQCECGAPFWSWRHIFTYELSSIGERLLWRYGWYRRLMTPTYQCPECRRPYHYCRCP